MEVKLDEMHRWITDLGKEFDKKMVTNLGDIRVDPGQDVVIQWTLKFTNGKNIPFWLEGIEYKVKIKKRRTWEIWKK